MLNLPAELLAGIFKYVNSDDYKTLYSCILVNKRWHNINILTLWRDPFYSIKSTEILIHCLLKEDNEFLAEHTKLKFERLEKPPLYNYAKFTTELDFLKCKKQVFALIESDNKYEWEKRLLDFILDYSTIRKLDKIDLECNELVNHHRFDTCFQNLYEIKCNFVNGAELFFDKLASACQNIQVLEINRYNPSSNINYSNKIDYSITQLIKAQRKITHLYFSSKDDIILSDDLKKAISLHSKSIIDYICLGNNNLSSLLMPTFHNLRSLTLLFLKNNNNFKLLKPSFFPNIESVHLDINYQSFLLDLSNFIKINGKTLKFLFIEGRPNDMKYLGELIESIAQNCYNLEDFLIFYKNELDQQLNKIFNNCVKLESITFGNSGNYTYDGDKILTILNQTLPKNLKIITFEEKVTISDEYSLEILMKNWKGPKPLKIDLPENHESVYLLRRYQGLGFLNYTFTKNYLSL